MISLNENISESIQELILNENENISISFNSDGGGTIRTTIVWNDPAATPPTPQNNPTTPMLVNDIDIRLERNSDGQIFYPWTMNSDNPQAPAGQGDNTIDNVEQVFLASAEAGDYTLIITHKNLEKNYRNLLLNFTKNKFVLKKPTFIRIEKT